MFPHEFDNIIIQNGSSERTIFYQQLLLTDY